MALICLQADYPIYLANLGLNEIVTVRITGLIYIMASNVLQQVAIMKYNVRLIYDWDDSIGEFGWRVKKFPFMNISNARGLTHDILEHSPNDTGTWHEEISAFGAIVAYRLNMSDSLYPQYQTFHDKLLELANFVSEGWERKQGFIEKLCTLHPLIEPHENIRTLADEASKLVQIPLEVDPDFSRLYISNFLEQWLKAGHIRATKVIEQSGWDADYIWQVVYETIDAELFKSKIEFYQGHEVSVQIDFDALRCVIKPINCKFLFW
jgi:hypothetical protein